MLRQARGWADFTCQNAQRCLGSPGFLDHFQECQWEVSITYFVQTQEHGDAHKDDQENGLDHDDGIFQRVSVLDLLNGAESYKYGNIKNWTLLTLCRVILTDRW